MIKLVLYGPEDKPVKTLVRSTIRWGTLKRAARIKEAFQNCNDIGEQLDEYCAIIADCFEGDATFTEIERGARAEDLVRVLNEIVSESARAYAANFRKGTGAGA